MNEQELRTLVREAIARHGAVSPGTPPHRPTEMVVHQHPSHGMFALAVGADADGPCLIEPAVMCNHCGYCKSWGY